MSCSFETKKKVEVSSPILLKLCLKVSGVGEMKGILSFRKRFNVIFFGKRSTDSVLNKMTSNHSHYRNLQYNSKCV